LPSLFQTTSVRLAKEEKKRGRLRHMSSSLVESMNASWTFIFLMLMEDEKEQRVEKCPFFDYLKCLLLGF
jgi:hypothetical protein